MDTTGFRMHRLPRYNTSNQLRKRNVVCSNPKCNAETNMSTFIQTNNDPMNKVGYELCQTCAPIYIEQNIK